MSGEYVFVLVLGALVVGSWLGIALERFHAPIRAARQLVPLPSVLKQHLRYDLDAGYWVDKFGPIPARYRQQ